MRGSCGCVQVELQVATFQVFSELKRSVLEAALATERPAPGAGNKRRRVDNGLAAPARPQSPRPAAPAAQ